MPQIQNTSKNAVIYARFSSSSQREESIEDQLRECTKFAQREGYNIISNYCDYAISGRTDERPEFLRMIDDAGKKLFNYIIVYRLDRFARNRVDSVLYKAQLAKQKVQVISATECIPEGSDGLLIVALHEALAQKYSDDLSKIIRRGQEGNAENCKSNGAYPFGYKVNPITRLLEIDEEKATLVRRIFEIIADGGTYTEALKYVNAMGYKRSRNWLYRLLRNERYKGIYIYKNHRVSNGIPRIVSDELFNAAGKTRVRHLNFAGAGSCKYLLSNKLFCPLCGQKLSGSYGTSKNGIKYRYYICNNKKYSHSCTSDYVSADDLEHSVLNMVKSFIFNNEIVTAIVDATINILNVNNPISSNIAALNRKILETDKKISNIVSAIEAGIITDTTKNRLQELEAQKKDFQTSLLEEKLKAPVLTRDQLHYFFNRFKTGDITNRQFQKYLLDNFVTKCYFDKGKTTVLLSLTGNPNDISYQLINKIIKQHKVFDNCNQWWR